MLKFFNTLTKREEEFKSIEPNKIKMYVCGITPYDSCHIGHARCYVVFDTIRRYFEFLGYEINYIQNFTDIDDKIINKSNALNVKYNEISEKYIDEYFIVMDKLNIKRANSNPKVSENIDKIVTFIERLVKKNYAYNIDGNVYFRVKNFEDYGKLSGRNLEELKQGARVEIDEKKENPLDFALWKKAKENEPFWESSLGKGRPGWHIECSVLATANLGETIDIHGGGADLIFPHHENEIAQSEALTDKKFAKYWIHNGFVMINKEKMSKSLGNFFTLNDILEKYEPMALRLFLLTNHYRKPLDFSDDKLEENTKRLAKFTNFYRDVKNLKLDDKTKTEIFANLKNFENLEAMKKKFCDAMNNDFNTAAALAELHEILEFGNKIKESDAELAFASFLVLDELAKVLGLNFELTEKSNEIPTEIQEILKQRDEARNARNWAESDRLRDILRQKGFEVKDTKNGTQAMKI